MYFVNLCTVLHITYESKCCIILCNAKYLQIKVSVISPVQSRDSTHWHCLPVYLLYSKHSENSEPIKPRMMLWLFSTFLQLLGLLVLVPVLFFSYKWLIPRQPKISLQKRDWERDVVYLCQFPLCPSVRTISPFALKLETWLRLTNIKYENIFTMKFHPRTHQIPYIELNGESLSDSNLIISKLTEHFGVSLDNDLTGEQSAMSQAATSMLENYTAQTGFHYRYGFNHGWIFYQKIKKLPWRQFENQKVALIAFSQKWISKS